MSPVIKDVPQGFWGFHYFLMAPLWGPSLWCLQKHWCPKPSASLQSDCAKVIDSLWSCLSGNICRHLLPLIQCPTLIVHGEKDPLVPRFHADFLLEHVKGSRWVSLQLHNFWIPQSLWGKERSHRKEKMWEKGSLGYMLLVWSENTTGLRVPQAQRTWALSSRDP